MQTHLVLVTRRCNHACGFCTRVDPDAIAPPLGELERSLREGLDRAPKEVVFSGGEPLLRSDLGPLFQAARAAGVPRVVVETNATLIRGVEAASALKEAGVTTIRVSLVTGLLETHRRLVSPSTSPQQIFAGITHALNAGLEVTIRLPIAQGLPTAASRLEGLHRAFPAIFRYELAPAGAGLRTWRPGQALPPPDAARELDEAFAAATTAGVQVTLAQDFPVPPCHFPVHGETWKLFVQQLARADGEPNTAHEACARCEVSARCRVTKEQLAAAGGELAPNPVRDLDPESQAFLNVSLQRRRRDRPVPDAILRKRPPEEAICIAPWYTMEVPDASGDVYQCCTAWTAGARGSVQAASLRDIWNGEGYRRARRIMSGKDISELCRPVCPRVHDRELSEKRLSIFDGTERFVRNQLLMLEDIAERREVMRAMPLGLALCPSTYCNYDCIMCTYGRTPRRDLPESIWDELPELLPTLKSLTFLGGEPLANHRTWEFLTGFDIERYPDVRLDMVTNGSLLRADTLERFRKCPFGNITISFNAGAPGEYEHVQRAKISFEQLVKNLDALIAFRDRRPWWFGIRLSFVVQPAATHTLIPFGDLARRRGLDIRLLPLNVEQAPELDFYTDDDAVARVIEHVDAFAEWAARAEPRWLVRIRAVRQALIDEAAARKTSGQSLVALNLRAAV